MTSVINGANEVMSNNEKLQARASNLMSMIEI